MAFQHLRGRAIIQWNGIHRREHDLVQQARGKAVRVDLLIAHILSVVHLAQANLHVPLQISCHLYFPNPDIAHHCIHHLDGI